MDQASAGISVDGGLAYSPKIFPSKLADSNHEGNVARGGDMKTLVVTGSKKFARHQLSAYMKKNFLGDKVEESQSDNIDTETSTTSEFIIGAQSLFAVGDFRLGVGIDLISLEGFRSTVGSNNIDYESTTQRNISFVAKYQLAPSKAFSFTYANAEMDGHGVKLGNTPGQMITASSSLLSLSYIMTL